MEAVTDALPAVRRRVYDMARRRARVLELPPDGWRESLPAEVTAALSARELDAMVALAWGSRW